MRLSASDPRTGIHMTAKVWDNGVVHVVRGDHGVVIALSTEAAHRLALVISRKKWPELEGWHELNSLREAFDCLLVGDPSSVGNAKRNHYLESVEDRVRKVATE